MFKKSGEYIDVLSDVTEPGCISVKEYYADLTDSKDIVTTVSRPAR